VGPAVVLIVSRSEPALFDYVRQSFAREPEVEVIVDRRHTERRQREAPAPLERRQSARRRHSVEEYLRAQGWAVVRRAVTPSV
jgi:hypothetical protein